jgi:hypothetical protein
MNVGGQSKIRSYPGALITLLLIPLFVWYVIRRTALMATRGNTNVTEAYLQNYFDSSYQIALDQIDFKMGFAVIGYFDQIPKDDPLYVEWRV